MSAVVASVGNSRQLKEREFSSRLAFLCKPLLSMAERRVGIHNAEDVLQDMQVRAWQIRDRFDASAGNDALFTWLAEILREQIRMFLRREVHRPETLLPPEALFELCDSLAHANLHSDVWAQERAALRQRVNAAVLTPRQRFCVQNWLDGISLSEIGESLEPPVSKAGIHKIIQRVGKLLAGMRSEEEDRDVTECIRNLPAALIYYKPTGVWDRRGNVGQIQARRRRIPYGIYRDGQKIDTAVDYVGRSVPAGGY